MLRQGGEGNAVRCRPLAGVDRLGIIFISLGQEFVRARAWKILKQVVFKTTPGYSESFPKKRKFKILYLGNFFPKGSMEDQYSKEECTEP